MLPKLVAGLFLVAIGVLVWALFGTPTQKAPKVRPKPVVKTQPSKPSTARPEAVPRAQPVKPKLDFDDDSGWTQKDVAKSGLIGRTERWVASVMDRPFWTKKSREDAPYRFINKNGVELTWAIKNGRVIGAAATFPETAFSADLTALSEFFVGQNAHLPVHFESNKKRSKVRYGDFTGPGGRTLYYRGRLRRSGTPPYGPEEFEIQLGPFPDQPILYEPQVNEHEQPDLD